MCTLQYTAQITAYCKSDKVNISRYCGQFIIWFILIFNFIYFLKIFPFMPNRNIGPYRHKCVYMYLCTGWVQNVKWKHLQPMCLMRNSPSIFQDGCQVGGLVARGSTCINHMTTRRRGQDVCWQTTRLNGKRRKTFLKMPGIFHCSQHCVYMLIMCSFQRLSWTFFNSRTNQYFWLCYSPFFTCILKYLLWGSTIVNILL